MPTFLDLVPLHPEKDGEDPLIDWLKGRRLWDSVSARVADAYDEASRQGRNPAQRYLPLEVEYDLRDELKLSQEAGSLLVRLQTEAEGILLQSLGVHASVWDSILSREDEFACAKLVKLGLAMVEEKRLKVTPIGSDQRVHYLYGLTPSPVAH